MPQAYKSSWRENIELLATSHSTLAKKNTMYTQADPIYPMTASSASPMQPRHSYPLSRDEAELHWEFERQRLRVHIASLPSSSFEKTKFEEDEYFYATFPEARRDAISRWIAERYPFAPWRQSQVAEYRDLIDITYDLSPAPCAPASLHVPTHTANFTTYTLAGALTLPPSPPRKASKAPAAPKAVPAVHYVYSHDPFSHDVHNSPDSVLTADTTFFSNAEHPSVDEKAIPAANKTLMPPEDDHVLQTLHLLTPARRSRRNTRKLPVRSAPTSRNQENTYPSTSPPSSRLTVDTPSCPPTPPPSLPSKPTVVPSNAPVIQPRYTGDWEADAIATAEYLHSAINIGKKPLVSISIPALPLLPIEPHIVGEPLPHSYHHPHRRVSRQRPRPYSLPPRSRSPSREPSRSMTPPNKRPKVLRDKNGKPIMACLFCRGRKIACGPPPKGSDDPTCNQCARRGLECQYPTINRRGMRKKKSVVDAHTSSETSSPSSTRVSDATLELVKIGENISISDYSDDSESEWDGDY